MSRENDVTSHHLDADEFQALTTALPAILRDLFGEAIVICQYGALSNLHVNLWYTPMDVGLKWIDRFLRDSIDQRIFEPGESDLEIATKDATLEIRLCHEGDVHVTGSDSALVRRFVEHPAVAAYFS